NAFSDRLLDFGFNIFSSLVVNMMHKFELGVWKAVFTHLMHIPFTVGGDAIQQLNQRLSTVHFQENIIC
ncbi:hypothetical protein GLOTRDRAFT_42245, partial [Gloeophyllum trabeum ATCC 11539]